MTSHQEHEGSHQLAVIRKYLEEFGTWVDVPCADTLRTVGYPRVSFGNSSSAAVTVENVLMALCREVLELGEKK